ncbi:hypothetical protein [Nitrospira sp. M1]
MERRVTSHTEEEEMNQRRRLLGMARKGDERAISKLFELYQVKVYTGETLKKSKSSFSKDPQPLNSERKSGAKSKKPQTPKPKKSATPKSPKDLSTADRKSVTPKTAKKVQTKAKATGTSKTLSPKVKKPVAKPKPKKVEKPKGTSKSKVGGKVKKVKTAAKAKK